MLIALYQGSLISIHSHKAETLKKLSKERCLLCPDCKGELLYRHGHTIQSHFSHVRKECSSPFSEPESIEHDTGKQHLYEWLSETNNLTRVELEYHISKTNQRADIFLPSQKHAVEFQCSPIQGDTWKKRRALYHEADVESFWVLGYSMHTYANPKHQRAHKLNNLERAVLEVEGKIIYYDTLTKQFVVLIVEESLKRFVIGTEYFFSPKECTFKNGSFSSKYDFFIAMQNRRRDYTLQKTTQAKETTKFINETRGNKPKEKVLATPKQINYLKGLLVKNGKQIPYKLGGLTKKEATIIIRSLENETKKTKI
ncbi:hypothetical protein IMZ31_21240 (plasmid) [Pontibacillus sp. ALD_SL1]|uniref:competence protein CoiA n=1 Tax=Pontibacillus sp. ALD_SL1 TaxID=2777185 RepID=UPI001A97832D|nr:competence protein CoiA family protein [Pontibacillus sp. ALD_SL1]QST03076.1 hypothetical protein IMZ31_21240 [Pontibacillus sp. ALD_SL1]